MFKIKCPACNSPIVKRNGTRDGVQKYMCRACGRQFSMKSIPSLKSEEVWCQYLEGKQTVSGIAKQMKCSESTVKRSLRKVKAEWEPPAIKDRHGVLHVDVTYFGRNSGVLAVVESQSSLVLHIAFTQHEKASDFIGAIEHVESGVYHVDGIVIDGNMSALTTLAQTHKVQMCQFHMAAIIRRKLTLNPRLPAGIELQKIMYQLTSVDESDFKRMITEWSNKYKDFLKEMTTAPGGKRSYTHRRIRGALASINMLMPYLFTYKSVEGMPNTNNKIEGMFTDLKKSLRNHSGMTKKNRERFIIGFFLAWNSNRHLY